MPRKVLQLGTMIERLLPTGGLSTLSQSYALDLPGRFIVGCWPESFVGARLWASPY